MRVLYPRRHYKRGIIMMMYRYQPFQGGTPVVDVSSNVQLLSRYIHGRNCFNFGVEVG